MKENFEFYSEKLYELRKQRGMSQEEFAEKIGVSRQSIYAWESGKSLPDIENLYKMCQILKIEVNELTNLCPLEKEPKVKKRNIKKIILIGLLVLVIIYLVIVFRHFFIVVDLNKKIHNIENYNNYSYKYVYLKYDKDESGNSIINDVYYKDGILKVIKQSKNGEEIDWMDLNNNVTYIFYNNTVRKIENEDISMINDDIYSIRAISNTGMISKSNFKNFIGSIFWPFNFKIQNSGNCYTLNFKIIRNRYLKIDTVYKINKETGYPFEKQSFRNDGITIYERYMDIKTNETSDDDVKMPDLNEYVLVQE